MRALGFSIGFFITFTAIVVASTLLIDPINNMRLNNDNNIKKNEPISLNKYENLNLISNKKSLNYRETDTYGLGPAQPVRQSHNYKKYYSPVYTYPTTRIYSYPASRTYTYPINQAGCNYYQYKINTYSNSCGLGYIYK